MDNQEINNAIERIKKSRYMELANMPMEYRDNKEIALAAVSNCASAIEYVSPSLQKDPEILKTALSRSSICIFLLPDDTQSEVIKIPEIADLLTSKGLTDLVTEKSLDSIILNAEAIQNNIDKNSIPISNSHDKDR